MNSVSIGFILAIILQIIIPIKCTQTKPSNSLGVSEDKFLFKRPEPGNALGIVPTVMAFVEREAKKTFETWRINRAFVTEENIEVFRELCAKQSIPGTEGYVWKDCVFTKDEVTFTLHFGAAEEKNKTKSYLSIDFEGFERVGKDGKDEVCKLDEVFDNTVYIALYTFSEFPKNDTFPRSVVDSVAVVHQDQLGRFGTFELGLFEDFIDKDAVYQFDQEDYLERESPYDCFLAIGGSASKDVLEQKCSFGCYNFKKVHESSPEYEKYLEMATGDRRGEGDKEGYDHEYDHDEL